MEMSLDLRVSAFACLQPGRPLDRKAGEKGQAHHVASGEPGLFWDCTGGEETRHEGEGRGVAWKAGPSRIDVCLPPLLRPHRVPL